jgi:hypothetical protein
MPIVSHHEGCFLCTPDAALVYYAAPDGVALCGLGPLVPGYSVVATRNHVRSAADGLVLDGPGFASFADDVRVNLAERYGSCLMTEHGRIPVCLDPGGRSEPHCYHCHFLLFPGAPSVESAARASYERVEEAHSLPEALALAKAHKEYFLFSAHRCHFLVMSQPGKLIRRQFSRFLVADAMGTPELASWRAHPDIESSTIVATELRILFAGRY